MKKNAKIVSLIIIVVTLFLAIAPMATAASIGSTMVNKALSYVGQNLNPGYAWCAWFVSKIARECGVSTSVIPNDNNVLSMAKTMVTQCGAKLYVVRDSVWNKSIMWNPSKGQYTINKNFQPQQGDIVLFDNGADRGGLPDGPDHIGFFVSGSALNCTTVEGNSNNKVSQNTYKNGLYGSRMYIWAYIRPAYGSSSSTSTASESSGNSFKKNWSTTSAVINGLGGKLWAYPIANSNFPVFLNQTTKISNNEWIYTSDWCQLQKMDTRIYASYPVGSGNSRKIRWADAKEFLVNPYYKVFQGTATGNYTVSQRANGAGTKVGSLSTNDSVFVMGESGNYYQVVYHVGSNPATASQWKMGFVLKQAVK